MQTINVHHQECLNDLRHLVENHGLVSQVCDDKVFYCEVYPLITAFQQLMPVPYDLLNELGKAAHFYYWSIMIADRIIDDIDKDPYFNDLFLLSYVLREKALQILHGRLGLHREYWSYFEQYNRQYVKAVAHQAKFHFGKYNAYSKQEMEMVMTGISAMVKTMTTAMAFLSSKHELIRIVDQSLDYYYLAINLHDDAQDWRKDLWNRRFSYTVSLAIERNDLADDLDSISDQQLGKTVFFSGIVEDVLTEALSYLQRSIEAVDHLHCDLWKKVIDQYREKVARIRNEISRIKKKEQNRLDRNSGQQESAHV